MSELDPMFDPARLDAAADAALKARRDRREPMCYRRGDWIVLEHGDGHIEEIAKMGEFTAEQVLARL